MEKIIVVIALAIIFLAIVGVNTFPSERSKYHCPYCGEKGIRLGWVAIGTGDNYFSNCAWIPAMDLYACPKCHLLFWEEGENK